MNCNITSCESILSIFNRIPRAALSRNLGLILGFASMLALMGLLAYTGLRQIEVAQTQLDTIVNDHMVKIELATSMHTAARERTLILQRIILSNDPFARDQEWVRFNQLAADFAAARAKLTALPLSQAERDLLAHQAGLTKRSVPIQEQVIELALGERTHDAHHLLVERAIPLQDEVLKVLVALYELQRQASAHGVKQALGDFGQAKIWVYGLSAAVFALGCLIAFVVIHRANASARERTYLATHDALTGLPNRLLLTDRLFHALARARRRSSLVAVLFLDLDRFKLVNDTLGHHIGDELLKHVADRLAGCVREGDTVARLGGDEFVIVLDDVPTKQAAAATASKVLEVLSQPFDLGGPEFFASASIGVSIFPQDGGNARTLLKNADAAMYQAKESGRNNIQYYQATFDERAAERLEIETALRHGLDRDEFCVFYQPQLCVRTGRITGVEALVRWNHPRWGILTPDRFLSIAEECGLIIPIGRRVLRQACEQLRDWQQRGFPRISMAVNLLGREFWNNDLLADVRDAIDETGIDPSQLDVELTEGVLIQNIDGALRVMRALKRMGVRLTVDDFGTGYSSLAYLKNFPLDALKIDRSFITDVTLDASDAAITRAVLALARSLDLECIAEGVETPQQLAFLRDLGCETVQGFLISEARPAAALENLLRSGWRAAA